MNTFLRSSRLGQLFGLAISLSALIPGAYSAEACRFIPGPDSVLKWTGFKFTEKSAVSGTFTDMKLTRTNDKRRYEGVEGMLLSHRLTINTLSVDAGVPARNTNLVNGLFKTFKETTMTARVAKVDGATASMILHWGGKDYTVPMTFTHEAAKSQVTLTGKIDLLEMGLKSAYDSIHKTCKDVHTGADGVARTWSEVELSFTQNYKCQ